MNLLFFDSETTGIPIWQEPSESEHQPHMVSLGALLVDSESREVKQELDVIIKPNGWAWDENNEAFKVHGITMERAMDEGIPEDEALDMFLALYNQCGLRVAHNTTWDNRIIRIALKRYRPDLIPDEVWKDKNLYYCTMVEYSKIFGGKWPKLSEAYKHFTGLDLIDAHSAMPDTKACLDVYWGIQNHLAGTTAATAA